jgi:cobalt-precorrin 5A hydrolase
MDLDQVMIIAGIGCRRSVSVVQVQAAIDAALAQNALTRQQLGQIALSATKEAEAGVHGVAAARGVRVVLVSQHALEAASHRTLTLSLRSIAAMNVPSVAEAAALAAAGPRGRLLSSRVTKGPVTCALAEGEGFR